MNSVNCIAGDYAMVLRPFGDIRPGTIVRVNFFTNALSEKRKCVYWDVESRGRFFHAADEDLRSLNESFAIPPGFRDELFDDKPIFSDGAPQ